MSIYESGREATLLQDIKAGRKTVECRLNRGKFSQYQPGDQVFLREDTYEDGQIVASQPRQAFVEVTKVDQYPTFKAMLESVGYQIVVPRAVDFDEALAECYKYYSPADESQYGVLAIHFHLVTTEGATQ